MTTQIIEDEDLNKIVTNLIHQKVEKKEVVEKKEEIKFQCSKCKNFIYFNFYMLFLSYLNFYIKLF